MNNDIAHAGEIWKTEMLNGKTREMLILRCFESYAAVLILGDEEPEENGLVVISRSKKWTDCGRLGYVYYNRLLSFVRSLPDDDFALVLGAVAETLGIEPEIRTVEVAPEATGEGDSATQSQNDLPQEAAQLMMDSAITLAEMTKERDIYKGLYEELLNRVLS